MTEKRVKQSASSVKFNLVDIIVVILVIAIAAFAGWKLLLDKNDDNQNKIKVTYVARCENVPKELYENCKAHLPSRMMASGESVDGQIESVEQQPYYVLGPDGQWVEDPEHVTLYFTATANVDDEAVLTTKVGTQEVRVGKSDHILKSEYVEFKEAVIVDVQWEKIDQE